MRVRTSIAAVWLALVPAACSLALDHSPDQCSTDSDCVRFRAVCNLRTHLCTSRGPSVDATIISRPADAAGDAGPDTADAGPPDAAAMALVAPLPAAVADWPCDRTQKPIVRVQGDIGGNDRWICDNDYLLIGPVLVRPGATLTILAGTTIRGDVASKAMLVVQPGARLVADGLRMAPIVFTSAAAPPDRRAGDWGGVALLGRAATSAPRPIFPGLGSEGEYGGSNDDDGSGVLRFVSLEYAGGGPAGARAGLGLRGVGRGTALNHIMVRAVAGDCFDFQGGTAAAKHLVCQHPEDDGFSFGQGYRGRLQFLALQAAPAAAGDSHAVEGDNGEPVAGPASAPTIYNATLCGRRDEPPGEQFGVAVRRGSGASLLNALVTGFEAALSVRDAGSALDVRSSLVWPRVGGAVETAAFLEPGRRNNVGAPNIGDCFDPRRPGFSPSPTITTSAAVPPSDGFFEPAAYLGAFRDRADDWTRGAWVNFSEF